MGSPKELIVPIFIPHSGCPHQCVFCNQKKITASEQAPTPQGVCEYLSRHLGPDTAHAVIAFYGGSFTGLPRQDQESYLRVAGEFVRQGFARGIRLSTRPDCVDAETAQFLKVSGVITVELGVQSLDNEVLRLSGRGHSAEDAVQASRTVKECGLELGIQLMAGLPGDSEEKFMRTVERTVALEPSFVRIYPALVVGGSPLEALWRRGEFAPLPLDAAVSWCSKAVRIFREADIRVIRLGLQAGRELEGSLLAGPYHPAFGHLVESELAFERMEDALKKSSGERAEFRVNPRELSVFKGIRGVNAARLKALRGIEVSIKADPEVGAGGLELKAS